jgi:hypothetical protein
MSDLRSPPDGPLSTNPDYNRKCATGVQAHVCARAYPHPHADGRGDGRAGSRRRSATTSDRNMPASAHSHVEFSIGEGWIGPHRGGHGWAREIAVGIRLKVAARRRFRIHGALGRRCAIRR